MESSWRKAKNCPLEREAGRVSAIMVAKEPMKIKQASVYSIIILILALVFEITTPSYAQTDSEDGPTDNYISQVYLTEEQALREVFPHCDEILFNVVPLTKEEKSQLQNKLRRKIYEDFFVVYMGIKSGEVTGYAIITEEIGKFHLIHS